jgi:hypothetical protein
MGLISPMHRTVTQSSTNEPRGRSHLDGEKGPPDKTRREAAERGKLKSLIWLLRHSRAARSPRIAHPGRAHRLRAAAQIRQEPCIQKH